MFTSWYAKGARLQQHLYGMDYLANLLDACVGKIIVANLLLFFPIFPPQDPAGIFELVELVGNGTYGQVYKVSALLGIHLWSVLTVKTCSHAEIVNPI